MDMERRVERSKERWAVGERGEKTDKDLLRKEGLYRSMGYNDL